MVLLAAVPVKVPVPKVAVVELTLQVTVAPDTTVAVKVDATPVQAGFGLPTKLVGAAGADGSVKVAVTVLLPEGQLIG